MLLAFSLTAVFTLLIGLSIQVGLGFWRYRESRAAAGQALAAMTSSLSRAEGVPEGEPVVLSAEAREKAESRLSSLAARKGETQREKHLELLLLVNPWNPLPENYVPELAPADSNYQIHSGYEVDARCAEALAQMLNDGLRAGYMPYICSAYRPQSYQQMLFDDKIERLIEEGVSPEDAPEAAAKVVALPGTSEHQLGLAVDLIDEDYPYLNEYQEWTGAQQWLMKHCWEYGFILRYPNGTSDITGIIYEPWHYRYVGAQHAQAIQELGLTLEEYLAMRRGR
jgi:D-alanyl-D-alanine carboxypeptidase